MGAQDDNHAGLKQGNNTGRQRTPPRQYAANFNRTQNRYRSMSRDKEIIRVTNNDGKPGFRQIIFGGIGSAQTAWHICRKAKTISNAIKGLSVWPKTPTPIRNMPKRSMNPELIIKITLARRGCACR